MKLIPTRASTALAVRQSGTLPAKHSATTLVLEGIKDLMVGFAAPSKEDEDTKRLIRLFIEAVGGFHELIATEAVRELRFDNPRNPFRPSPQDVRERCQRISGKLHAAIGEYFTSWRGDERWPSKWGDPPFTPGCLVPDDLVKEKLSQWLRASRAEDSLRQLDRERLDRIPDECFADGQRAAVLAKIERREKEEAEREARQKYLESLDSTLRKMREEVIRWNSRGGACTLSEDAIIELAKERIAAEEQRHQELVRKIEELKVSDPDLYARAEQKARRDHLVYRWCDMGETERLEAIGQALHLIELSQQIDAMRAEEQRKLEAQKAT